MYVCKYVCTFTHARAHTHTHTQEVMCEDRGSLWRSEIKAIDDSARVQVCLA